MAEIICPECGYPINGEKTCPECGHPIGQFCATTEEDSPQKTCDTPESQTVDSQESIQDNSRGDSMQNHFSFVLGQVGDYIFESFQIAKDSFFKGVGDFYGRATRREYFSFMIVWGIVALLFTAIVSAAFILIIPLILWGIFAIWFIIASVAVTVRRLHDAGFSGWYVLYPPYSFFYVFKAGIEK